MDSVRRCECTVEPSLAVSTFSYEVSMALRIRSGLVLVSLAALACIPAGGAQVGAGEGRTWSRPAHHRSSQRIETKLLGAVEPKQLSVWHELVSSEPHVAGTPADGRVVNKLVGIMKAMGLEVEKQEVWVYLAHPVSAELEIVSPVKMSLAIRESPLDEDPYSSNPKLMIGWNAYSGSGEVSAPVVYANYGRKEDFAKLKEMGVDLTGKIVIARYGGNFRGYKAKFAEQAGAVGLIIYTDPKDSGYVKGLMYPEGGWSRPDEIQRGSILTLPWTGDPLTPFVEATKDAERLDPSEIDLPKIPVQPIGWGAAKEILSRLSGPAVPDAWQGGLPFNYHMMSDGDDGPIVRLKVVQKREVMRTWNVVGVLKGAKHPEQMVIMGSHHDAWGFGAADPNAGTIVVLEAARVLSEAAARGDRPDRSIVFANWGAEEFGILGSVEWVEANRQDLIANAVAYINLDSAVMGPNFDASASPMLKEILIDVARAVPAVADDENSYSTVYDEWMSRQKKSNPERTEPHMGNLGGGSDHIGFYSYAGTPSAGIRSGGAKGTSYHSAFDNLHWWRQVVDGDYEAARMVTQMTMLTVWRLANEEIVPLDPVRYATDVKKHAKDLSKRATKLGVAYDPSAIFDAADEYGNSARSMMDRLSGAMKAGSLDDSAIDSIDLLLISMERLWMDGDGLPDRPWYKNLFASNDPDSGYAAWMLPLLRWAIESKDEAAVANAVEVYADVLKKLTQMCSVIDSYLPPAPAAGAHTP